MVSNGKVAPSGAVFHSQERILKHPDGIRLPLFPFHERRPILLMYLKIDRPVGPSEFMRHKKGTAVSNGKVAPTGAVFPFAGEKVSQSLFRDIYLVLV